jgi:hypothetical protein
MAADTSVKYFSNGLTGAPAITGVAGSYISFLDAVLVNGFNLKAVATLEVIDGWAWVTVTAGHGYGDARVVLIDGVTSTPTLNGEKRITSVSTTQFKFDCAGVANGVQDGTLTAKYAPLGWSKTTTGTNTATYKANGSAVGAGFYVDDSAGKDAVVYGRGYHNGNTPAQNMSAVYFPKAASASAVAWQLIGNNRGFYISTQSLYYSYFFSGYIGELVGTHVNDVYNLVTIGANTTHAATGSTTSDRQNLPIFDADKGTNLTTYSWKRISRLAYQAPNEGYITLDFLGSGRTGSSSNSGGMSGAAYASFYGASADQPVFPSPLDGGLFLTPVHVFDRPSNTSIGCAYRGRLPGAYATPQAAVAWYGHGWGISGVNGLANRNLICLMGNSNAAENAIGFIDTTGPWE